MDKKKGLSWEEIHWIQIEEILKHKWIKSEECGRDLGDEAVKDWVVRHAAAFREYWERKCKELNDEEIDEES
jgi:hypothetical protein